MKTNLQTKTASGLKIKLAGTLLLAGIITNAQQVNTLAGSTSSGSSNGTSAEASFTNPFGVTTDNNGTLYIADAGNNEIRKLTIATGEVTTVAGSTQSGYADGNDTSAMFNYPTGVACDGQGNLFVVDCYNNCIRKIVLATGVVSTLAGSGADGSNDGVSTAASFYHPCGIVADGQGNLYIAGGLNSAIRKIDIATGAVTTIAGSSSTGSSNGKGSAASFNYPAGITADGQGNLYVIDEGNNEVRKIVIASGMVTTVAGCTAWGSANGASNVAKFDAPYGITADGNGNLFITDADNNEIRKMVIATGMVSTYAGSRNQGALNGTGTQVSFNNPRGITSDGNGNLYIADYGNNEIRTIATLFTGIENVSEVSSVSAYPNPASQNINFSFTTDKSEHGTFRIVDVTGREVMSIPVTISNNQPVQVDINSLTIGTYFAQVVMDDSSVQTVKFIKQ